ncbi:gem-associated protein 7 [Tachysurus vachellii]|uniref:gem-associated protein 7 n=1 Tax=Tachysurus vachellii TaxID=175792 RepID=UPI00296ADD8D|nr:gem-associated protein 7 [Tachysurus vachellii]
MREPRECVIEIKPERMEMKNPVNVLRLPRGPDLHGRGFDPSSPRYVALCPSSISASSASCTNLKNMEEEQRIRSELRERFLRTLISMTDKQVHFRMYEKVQVQAKFGSSDIDILNFQVSDLQTPLGVQKEALLRCQDVISFSFNL